MFVITKIRLAKETCAIQTKTGNPMMTAFGFADIDGDDGLPLGIVTFGNLADELAKYKKGSAIRVSGEFKANHYTANDGTEKSGWQIVCDGMVGIKSQRGRYSTPKPKADPEKQQERNQASQDFYEDWISF